MNSFFITYRPDTESPRGWPMKSLKRLARRVKRTGRAVEPWRFRNRKDVSVGDRVFLLLQGRRGPAIIGYGKTTDQEGQTWRGIELEVLVDPEVQVLAGKEELLAIGGAKRWLATQASGVCLPKDVAAAIEAVVIGRTPIPADGKSGMHRVVVTSGVFEAPEGRLRLIRHFAHERDRRLVEAKRNEALKKYGKLSCEVCALDFDALYGSLGSGVIECHHTSPLATLRPGDKTHIDDLALICANCHRVLHKGGHTINSLKYLVRRHSRG
jgi:HNH endonuclease